MIAAVLLLTMASPGQAEAQAEPATEEIVVRAPRQGSRQCRVEFQDREISERGLDARAKEWAKGTRVRVRAAADADIRCLSKITFQLADKGVTLIEFIDPQGKPGQLPLAGTAAAAAAASAPPSVTVESGSGSDITARERAFVGRRAARLVLEGKCDEARKLVLEAGDLQGAANVVTLCRAE